MAGSESRPWWPGQPDEAAPESPEALYLLEAHTQQQRSADVFEALRQQLERLERMGAPDEMHRSFHVLPGPETGRSVFFETCRHRPGGQSFSFSHIIVNDRSATLEGDRRLDVREFAVFAGHNTLVCNKSAQIIPSRDEQWTIDDTSGPVLVRLDGTRVRILRGRENRLLLPVIKRRLAVSEIMEQRVLAADLTEVLWALGPGTHEEHVQLAS